jgi:GT2 family glycosyltransferase
MQNKKISVVIPVYNALPELKKCLASLRDTARGLYELILVDNASGPETRKYITGLRDAIKVRNASNMGFARAVNQGIRKASGRYITVVNSDIIFFPGVLAGLAACLDAEPSTGAVGPLTNRTVGAQQVELPGKAHENQRSLRALSDALRLKFADESFEVHRLVGFCFMVRREAIDSIGLLDERFGIGCYEDYDYSLRLRQAGWRLKVTRGLFVRHAHHASFDGSGHFASWVMKNREVFIDKWCRKALEFLDELDPCLKVTARSIKR